MGVIIAMSFAALHITTNNLRSPQLEEKLKGVIVEFVGPTGGGKSTNCKTFSQFLTARHLKVGIFGDVKDYFHQLPGRAQAKLITNAFLHHGMSMLSFTWLLMANHIYRINSLYRFIKLCIFHEMMIEYIDVSNVNVLLLDQWAVQGLWSATIFSNRTAYEKILTQLSSFFFPVDLLVYLNIDANTASDRIMSRDVHKSRFDQMDHSKRMMEFSKYNYYLLQLFEQSPCKQKLRLSAKDTPQANAEEFMNYLQNHWR